ncbi:hypothetical protein Tco_0983008 [Tanacetum coccineum]
MEDSNGKVNHECAGKSKGLTKNRKSKGKAKIHETDYYDATRVADINEKTGTKRTRASSRLMKLKEANDLGVGSSDGVNKNKVDTSKSVSVKRRRTSAKNNSTSLVLETRSSPKTFYNSISTLKPNQKACLEQIGFGNFVEFKVDGIPSKLGLYVVDKFDAKKMQLKLAEGSLKITKNLISEMLGIRNEGIDIMAEEGKRNEEMGSSWMKQYGNKKDITPGDIRLRIYKSNNADMNFKLNFIVLFTSVMGQIKTKGFYDLKILDYLSPDTDMANINWCEYVLRCLKSCKEEWTKGKKNFFPMCNSFNVVRKRPPTLVWTSELLREREEEELNSGGFGLSEIKGPFVKQEDPMPDNIELNKHVNSIIKEKSRFEKTLDAAEIMFPGNLDGFFERYVDALKYQGCRKEGSGNANIEDSNRDADAQANSVEAMIREVLVLDLPKSITFRSLAVKPIMQWWRQLRRANDNRPATISEVRKSPFIGRVVDADGSLNAKEKRVTKYLVEVFEDHSVTLFETISGQQSTRVQMESLVQRENVDNNILDTWGSVLNHMEVYRSKESPFRMFLPTFVVNNTMYNKLLLSGWGGEGQDLIQILIPVDNGGHKFLFVADLKNSRPLLIDYEKNEKILRKRVKKEIRSSDNIIVAAMLARYQCLLSSISGRQRTFFV